MSKQDHNTNLGDTPPSAARERFEQERVTRRAMLRRLGLTAGASLFGLIAADDVVRATLTKMRQTETLRGVADSVAVEFRNAGVAFAQTPGGGGGATSYCGVNVVPCKTCPSGSDGNPPPPCTEPYCNHCVAPTDCDDCMAVADYAYCNCMQNAFNNYPGCFDQSGNPTGNPGCVSANNATIACTLQRDADYKNCSS